MRYLLISPDAVPPLCRLSLSHVLLLVALWVMLSVCPLRGQVPNTTAPPPDTAEYVPEGGRSPRQASPPGMAPLPPPPPPATSAVRPRFTLFPLPTLGSSPETGFYAGAVVQATARIYDDTATRYSVGRLEATYTVRRQFIVGGDWEITGRNNDWILMGQLYYLRFPEYYWGIGNSSTSGDRGFYDARRIEGGLNLVRRIFSGVGLYAGGNMEYGSVFGIELLDERARNRYAKDLQGYRVLGFGPEVLYDTRSRVLNPRAGEFYLLLRQHTFPRFLNREWQFAHFEQDLRAYFPLFPNTILALQYFGLNQGGIAPFRMLGLWGGDGPMRGYYQGRYRDSHLHAAQAEVRFPLFWRLRGVAFGGTGDVAPRAFALDAARLKHFYGAGLRFLVDAREQTYMRFDFARGIGDNAGFYIGFGEAF